GREHRRVTSGRGDYRDLLANQFGRQRRQSIDLIFGPTVLDRHVLALDIAGVLQALAKSAKRLRESLGRLHVEESDHRRRLLLRARRERPRGRSAAEQCDEVAAGAHSMTSSASNCIDTGTSMPSALAVFMLITSSNFVGCRTGRSAGFSPSSIRP